MMVRRSVISLTSLYKVHIRSQRCPLSAKNYARRSYSIAPRDGDANLNSAARTGILLLVLAKNYTKLRRDLFSVASKIDSRYSPLRQCLPDSPAQARTLWRSRRRRAAG